MSKPIVILAGGRLRSGKDTFADHLVDKHNFVKLGMSDTLAEALYRLNPWVWDIGEKELVIYSGTIERYQELVERVGYVEAKKNPEVRRLLQVLGTEVGRQLLGENIWVEAAKKKIFEELAGGAAGVILTGARYPNELALADQIFNDQDVAATTVWVRRAQVEVDDQFAAHSSEGSVQAQDFEYILFNDDSLQELYDQADALLETIQEDFA